MAVVLAVTTSWPISRDGGFLLLLGSAAIACLCLGLLAIWVRGLAWGLALLAATFLLRVQLDPATASAWTPLVAGALLLVAELGYWSFELDRSTTIGSAPPGGRLLEVLGLVAATTALCELVLDLGAIVPISGGWVLVLGVIAAMGLLTLMLRLARRAA
ncbi:MAG: hypothetical protein M3Z98_04280 [Candidatus Dormibacteraeota bacterium]|nr:hypothetical protein [Candidatus Dormibacteraeota bacterium]